MVNIKFYTIKGFTLLEMIVSMGIAVFILLGSMSLFTESTTFYNDIVIREHSQDSSESILNMLGKEIRIIGNGVPFDQANFKIDSLSQNEMGVIDVTTIQHPITISGDDAATTDYIKYKLNESGNSYFLIADFAPTTGGNPGVMQLTSTEGLFVGDRIFVNNSTINGDDGFTGTVASIDSSTQITLDEDWFRSENAVFLIGSLVEPVNEVAIYQSGNDIVRDNGIGDPVILANNATLTLTYLSRTGSVLTPPLSITNLRADLGSIRIGIAVTSSKKHKILNSKNSQYTITKSQTFGLRAFNFSL